MWNGLVKVFDSKILPDDQEVILSDLVNYDKKQKVSKRRKIQGWRFFNLNP